MKKYDITQDDVAERLKKTQGTIAHWLSGRRQINLNQFFEFANKGIGCQPEWLLFGPAREVTPEDQKMLNEVISRTVTKLLTSDPASNPHHEDLMKRYETAPKPKKIRKKPLTARGNRQQPTAAPKKGKP